MPNYNKLTIIGHIGHTPQAKATNSGATFTTFPVAVTEYRKKADGSFDENTTWFDCVCYDKYIADRITRGGICRGALVMVSGPVSCRAFVGKDGSSKASMSITVREFVFLASRSQGGANGADQGASGNQQAANPYAASNNPYSDRNRMADAAYQSSQDEDDGLPF